MCKIAKVLMIVIMRILITNTGQRFESKLLEGLSGWRGGGTWAVGALQVVSIFPLSRF